MVTTIFNYTVIERKVKRARIELRGGEVRVVVPKRGSALAEAMVREHSDWIMTRLETWKNRERLLELVTVVDRTHWDTQVLIEGLIGAGAPQLGVQPQKISYRTMRRRWGSCSNRGDLVFNWNLRFLPEDLVGYVVYHELCHLVIHSHDIRFKTLMRQRFGDLKVYDERLQGYWQKIHLK